MKMPVSEAIEMIDRLMEMDHLTPEGRARFLGMRAVLVQMDGRSTVSLNLGSRCVE